MKNGDQMNQDAKRQLQLPDRVTRTLMQHSRRGFLGWCGKIGIALVGGTIGLNISPSFAAGTTGPAATTPNLGIISIIRGSLARERQSGHGKGTSTL